MYYQILNALMISNLETCLVETSPYAIHLSREDWHEKKEAFQLDMDLDFHTKHLIGTKVEVNGELLTGSFAIPNRVQPSSLPEENFAFILSQDGVIFIGDSPVLSEKLTWISQHKRWKNPSLERFLYDLIESLIADDTDFLEGYNMALSELEGRLLENHTVEHIHQLNNLRRDLVILDRHYEQLIDLTQELFENENDFFKEENLRYFHLLSSRISRLQTLIRGLRDYISQIRDLYRSQMDMKQNKLMSMLTIVTTCCLPLNILVGWYGMNFKYMPELSQKWAYPVVIIFAISIFSFAIYFFKKRKWL